MSEQLPYAIEVRDEKKKISIDMLIEKNDNKRKDELMAQKTKFETELKLLLDRIDVHFADEHTKFPLTLFICKDLNYHGDNKFAWDIENRVRKHIYDNVDGANKTNIGVVVYSGYIVIRLIPNPNVSTEPNNKSWCDCFIFS